jgi:GT2 family glycosyltransferase
MHPRISILITDFRQPIFTKLCIQSIKNARYKDIEILTRDNSNDNIGLAASSNLLAKKAKGEYLFFLNNDTIVKTDIFDRLLESKFDIVGCRMFDYQGRVELSSKVSLDRFGCPAGETGPIFYPDGAIFIRRKVFEEIGGFDEKLFLYGEDRDLCWRALLAGYTVGYNHNAVFYHNTKSVGCTNYYQRYHAEKNYIRSMLKNYTGRRLLRILPEYIFWSVLELGLIVFIKPMAIFKSYFPAYWWNIKNLKDTLKQRRYVIHKIADKELPFSNKVGKFYVLQTGVPKWRKS